MPQVLIIESIEAMESQALYNHVRAYQGGHVIIDPLASTTWADCLHDEAAAGCRSVPVAHEYYGDDTASALRVVHIPLERFDLMEELAGLARREATDPACKTRSVCGIVTCPLPPETVAKRLSAGLTVRVGRRKIYFRYFDPRVMHHLADFIPMGIPDLERLESWAYFDWEGCLVIHRFDRDANRPEAADPFRLSEVQWQPFEILPAFNATIVAFKQAGLNPSCSETARLRLKVADAIKLGLAEPEDVALYLVLSSQAETPPCRHVRWSEAISLVSAGVPLEEALDGLGIVPSRN